MRDFVSKRAKNIKPSGIRKFFDLCQGSKDIISLGVGEPDFITPYQISQAGIRTIKAGKTQYTSNKGDEGLREEISAYLKNRFKLGETYKFFGKVQKRIGFIEMNSPVFDKQGEAKNTGKIIPLYPVTYNLSQNTIRQIIENGLNLTKENIKKYLYYYCII